MLMLMSSSLLCCQVNVCFTWLKGGVPPVLEFLKVFNCSNIVRWGKFTQPAFLTHKHITAQRMALTCHIKGMNNGYPEVEESSFSGVKKL